MTKVFKIPEEDYNKIIEFANRREKDAQLYMRRGGFKRADIISGAMGEFGAYYYLQSKGIDCSKPDLRILSSKDKSYDADLRDNARFYHVKSQNLESQKRYGSSWLLQRYDKIAQKPLKRHYFILCTVDVENREVTIKATPSVNLIHKYELFDECKHPAFRRTKRALYLKQLDDKLNTKQMWRI